MSVDKSSTISIKKIFQYYLEAFTKKNKVLYIIIVCSQILRTSSFVISPFMFKKVFDYISEQANVVKPENFTYVFNILLLIIFIRLLAWVVARIYAFSVAILLPEVNTQLKSNAYSYLMRHSYTFFANSFVGGLTQKVNKYADSFWSLSERFTNDFLVLFIKVTGMIIVLLFVDIRIGIAMFGWIFIFLFISFKLSKIRKPISIARATAITKTNSHLSDTIGNQNSASLFSLFWFEEKSFKSVLKNFESAVKKRALFDAKVNAFYSGFIIFAELGLVGGALYLWSKGQVTIGTIILLQTYIISLIDDVWGFSRIVQAVEESYADAREMVEILETPHEVQDKPDAKLLQVIEGKISFENVTFKYNEKNEALSSVNITVLPGQKLGLIGPSGAGKSTFVKLLLRFFDITEGSIKIDSQDIRDVTQDSLHTAIGFVPQDPALFHRTLRENIAYGKIDATDEEIIEAAKKAHAHEFISVLPDGYNTLVGERGIKLSGGERQRVAIARAILKNAPILVLDEATSALDSESERLIQDALNKLMEGKTVLVIAHRLSTIQHMDRILVVDQGKIIEDGEHKSLLSKENSLYKKLWNLQAGGFIQ